MGLVDGESVAQRVERKGPMPPSEVVRVLREVAGALHVAHERGIVHRDVKAENILLDGATGRAMVTDFGIARLAEATPLTVTGLVLGTVHYMSPEHVSGETVDARSDLYSLGIVAFYALTGIFPFPSESPYAVLVAHVTRPAPRLLEIVPDAPSALGEIVDRCLAKDRDDRFPTCTALVAALDRVGSVSRSPVAMKPPPPRAADGAALLSESEARAVWDRAARLQEQTLGIAAPDTHALERSEHGKPASPSAGFRLDVVRESAREAGIATQFVDRALGERGHVALRNEAPAAVVVPGDGAAVPASPIGTTAIQVRDVRGPTPSIWTGAPSDIEFEVVVDGEMPERDFDWLVETIRRTLGDVGNASTVGRSMSWSSADPKRRIHVSVHVRGGRTTIHVVERLSLLRQSVFGGGVGGFGGGFSAPTFALTLRAWGEPLASFLAVAGLVGTIYAGSRFAYRTAVNERRRILHDLAERLGVEAESSIRDLARSNSASYLPARRSNTPERT
jgi:serine/threonine-protein kinase